MNWYKMSQDLFRADENPFNIDDFDPEYGVREKGKDLAGSMAHGPGLYFANKEEYAKYYGQNITRRKLSNANIVDQNSKKFTYQQIAKMLKMVNKDRLENAILNWNENINEGFRMLANAITKNDNPIDQLMAIWADVFYHQNAKEFIDLMVASGIDGISWQVNKENSQYSDAVNYVIYNKSILT